MDIAQHKKWLVGEGNEIGEKAKDNKEWKSQIRGIWDAARTETEPQVLLNFLRYQGVRGKNWREPENVLEPMEAAMKKCIEKAEEQPESAMELIRHLLAYTYRAFTFHSHKSQRENNHDHNNDNQ